MASSSTQKLNDPAMAVINRGPEPFNSSVSNHVASGDKGETVATEGNGNPQHRRPDLGRKQARFSFKHNSNGPSVSLMPSLDAAKLNDPVEYFLAHEKLENAKKEIRRQTGTLLIDVDEEKKTSGILRGRRPGLLGKSAIYRHRELSMTSNNENSGVSQASLESDIPTPSQLNFKQAPADLVVATQENDFSDSEIDTEQGVSNLLDDLMLVNYEALEGDDDVNLLKERLQLKQIDMGKMNLPKFHEFQKSDFPFLDGNLWKPRNALADIQNTYTTISKKAPTKHQHGNSSVLFPGSPTPPKSPSASINSLNERVLQSSSSAGPIKTASIDPLPANDYAPTEGNSVKSGDPVKLKPPTVEEDAMVVAKTSVDEVPTDGGSCNIENYRETNGLNQSENVSPTSSRDHSLAARDHYQCANVYTCERLNDPGKEKLLGVENDDIRVVKMDSHEALTEDSTCDLDGSVDHTFGRLDIDDAKNNLEAGNMKEVAVDKNSSSLEADSIVQLNELSGLGEEAPPHGHESVAEGLPEEVAGTARSDSQIGEPILVDDRQPEPQVIDPEPQIKEKTKAKAKAPPRRREELPGRKSLAGAGTSWQSGMRRSTRIRSRPLEFWKGERFLYGRVHKSLVTVIGLKYASPEKGEEEATMKVKSYVSDEYKELVELAALH